MDFTTMPKLAVAALVGGAATIAASHLDHAPGVLILKLEWIGQGRTKTVDSIVLRTVVGETTVAHQGTRVITVTPILAPEVDGTANVRLEVADGAKSGAESVSTIVRSVPGETVVVMGTTQKAGKTEAQRLFFLTATPQ